MNFDDEMAEYGEQFDIKTVGDMCYCHNLYRLAESVEATNILEIGFGWGFSAMSFLLSLSKREGKLTSVDPFRYPDHLSHKPERNAVYVTKKARELGVDYTLDKQMSADFTPIGPYCLVYIDADPYLSAKDYIKYAPYVRDGGVIVIDGYPGQWPVKATVETIEKELPFDAMWYSDTNSHAVFTC